MNAETDNVILCGDTCNISEISFARLKKAALDVTGSRTLDNAAAGSTSCAILTDKGKIYTGISVNTVFMNMCAEQSAVAAMVAACESRIEKAISVDSRGTICLPCEKCRQLMLSISSENAKAEIMTGEGEIAVLADITQYNNGKSKTVLESERLRLVPLTTDNVSEVFNSFTPDITTYMFPAAAKDISETEAFVNTTLDKMAKGKEIVYAVRIKETDEFIGLGGIHNIKSGCPEIGIWTKKTSHGNGYGFETVSRLIAYIRECIPFDHILYPVDRRNYPSRRIPMLHGGKAMKEYNITNMSGDTLEIIEYWIK